MNEKQLQKHIWKNKDNLHKLFLEIEFPLEIKKNKLNDYQPSDIIYNKLIRKYRETWHLVKGITLLGCEVSLRKEGDSTIRVDFIGNFEGTNGIAIIELKKSKQTERQSFTELLAYGSHIRTLFAPMSKIDIAYILIAPMEERIVREAMINTLIYDRHTVFALRPLIKEENVISLKLEPWIPSLDEVKNILNVSFVSSNFDVCKIVWEDLPGEWSPEKEGENPTSYMIDRLNIVSAYAAQLMESKGIHGFVYAQQTFSELKKYGHLINSIIIVGLNPYRATQMRILYSQFGDRIINEDINRIVLKFADILPEIKNRYFDESSEDVLEWLDITWSSGLLSIGFEVVKTMTKSIDKKSIQIDQGTFSWNYFQTNLMENIYVHNFHVRPTGLIRELYWDYLKLFYDEYSDEDNSLMFWGTDDIPKYLVDMSTHHYFFQNFLERLVDAKDDFI